MARSIRHALTWWYVGVLTLTLTGFSAALYAVAAVKLSQDLNHQLAFRAARAAETIFAFWRAERSLSGPGNWQAAPLSTFAETVSAGDLSALISRWAEKTRGLDTDHPIRLLDRHGQVIAQSPGFAMLPLPVNEAALTKVWNGEVLYETVRLNGKRRRLLTVPVAEHRRTFYVLQLADSLDEIERSLRWFGFSLLGLVPLTVAVTSWVGWSLASRALRPVGDMVTKAQRISVGHLDERLDVPRSRDELGRLAATFNDMLARIERGFQQLRRFSAAASHELRTPLTAMRGELEVTLRKPRTVEEYQRILQLHLETIKEMTQTVMELLALAHSEAAEAAINRQPVELGALVQSTTDALRPLVRTKALQLQVAAQTPVWIHGERRLLERVVANLLDNAVRHTPPQGHVMIQTERKGDMACLTVRDTGSGIPVEELSQIFDRFFKSPAASGETPSTGLGLGLCRWIVEAHQGRIDVTSAPGQGATFTVWLPASSSPA